jgi:hypothetical protein
MGIKKRAASFVSNWLGVIIAIIIVALSSTFGGMYLYGRSRLDSAISFVTQTISLPYNEGFTRTGATENPPGYSYHLILRVYNPYPDTLDVAVSGITVSIDGYDFTVIKDGLWDKDSTVGYTSFEGYITIDNDTYAVLADKGPVDVDIKGNISASGRYRWISRQDTREFSIPIANVRFEFVQPAQP